MNNAETIKRVGDAIENAFTLKDADQTNMVSVVGELADSARAIANAILPPGAAPNHDAAGSMVGSLTEAAMGITAGLCQIADAINHLADVVENRN